MLYIKPNIPTYPDKPFFAASKSPSLTGKFKLKLKVLISVKKNS